MREKEYEGYLDPKLEATVDGMSYDGIPRQQSFADYLNILTNACEQIDELYFNVPLVTDVSTPRDFKSVLGYRERVYCYELYHQQRVLLEQRGLHKRALLLNAETDKGGTIYTTFVGARKPDFVLHRPGEGTHNIATVEVKPISGDRKDIEADLGKLKEFLDPKGMNYFGAVALTGC